MGSISRLSLCISAYVLSTIAGPVIAQAPSAVNIPTALQGRYVLEVTEATQSSPLKNTDPLVSSDDISLYVSPIGEMCLQILNSGVNVISSQPQLQYGYFGKVSWDIEGLGMRFTLDISKSSFDGFDVLSLAGTQFARLTGNREGGENPDTGSCRSSTFDSRNALTVINAAESAFPAYFPKSALSVNQIGDGFDLYRYYPSSQVYLAIKDNTVFARGGKFGTVYMIIGYVDDLLINIANLRVPSSDNRIAFFQGTYSLDLTDTLPVSPIPDATRINLVVGDGGLLCVGEKNLAFPSISGANAIWSDPSSKLQYVLDLSRSTLPENFGVGEFSLQSTSGNTFGLFAGDQISLSKECSGAQGIDPDLASKNAFFTLIEKEYPALFPSGPQTFNQTENGFTYRYYFGSQIYVGIKNNTVYANGGQFGFNQAALPVGSLSVLTAQINDAPVGHSFPVTAAGTYTMSFSGASVFSPFIDGATSTVVFDNNGVMCLNGTNFGVATSKSSSPSLASWENSNLGLKFSVDTTSITDTSVGLSVSSTTGQAYSTLSGTRTSFEISCGASSGNLSISKANQLFGLAEQYFPQYFPSNILSVNQLSGNKVHRFYQSTGMFLTISGQEVLVRGGPYGGSDVNVGNIDGLIDQLNNSATTPPVSPAPVYDLRIIGTGNVTLLGKVQQTNVDIKNYDVGLPDSAIYSELSDFVRNSLAGTLTKIDSISVYSIVSTSTRLVFSATVSNSTTIGSTVTTRSYDLTYTLTRR